MACLMTGNTSSRASTTASMLVSIVYHLHCIYFTNHNSTCLDPEFISEYIKSVQEAGRYSEGFDPDTLFHLIGPFWTAPLGLTPKPHSDAFHLIEDLSFLHNNPIIAS